MFDTLILAISGAIVSAVVLLIIELVIVTKLPDQLIYQQVTLLPLAVIGATVGGIIFGGLSWIILRLAIKAAESITTQVVLGAIGGVVGMMAILYWLVSITPLPQ